MVKLDYKKEYKDLIIVGAGPAGIAAAIYGVRYGLDLLVFEQSLTGGQITQTAEVENYPALETVTGFDFAMNLHNQAVRLGVPIFNERVVGIHPDGQNKRIETQKNTYAAKTVIIASGAKKRLLGCPGEEEFKGKGVAYCASCDGFFFKGKEVVVVGGGNTALEDALFLANLCKRVYLVHRRATLGGLKPLQSAVKNKSNIEVLLNCSVVRIDGEEKVSSVRVLQNHTESELSAEGIFIAVGTEPDNGRFEQLVRLDEAGYILADESCQTNVEGVYAAGDCRTKKLRQIVTATADGAVSAYMASNYLNSKSL